MAMKGKLFLTTINGIDHCPFAGFVDPVLFRRSLTYQPDPTDIFIATYLKSGTTWTHFIVDLLMNDAKSTSQGCHPSTYHHLEYFGGKERIEQIPKPRWIKTHFPFELVPYNSETKYICVARNPFDCCVSLYFHNSGVKAYQFDGTFDEFFEYFINGKTEYGDYFHHVMSWYAHKDDENILLLTYESMIEDLRNAVKQMGNFIGGKSEEIVKDEQKLSKIVKMSSFDSMQLLNDRIASNGIVCNEGFKFIRKGQVSDFRNYFKKEQYDRLREKYDSYLKATTLHQYWSKFIEYE